MPPAPSTQLVSVIMPAYNAQATLADAVQSVLQQTHSSFELLIIDDCSCDETANILAHLAQEDSRIIPIIHSTNLGVAHARNTGIKLARGDYLAFLDADDLWLPEKLSKQIDLLHAQSVLACMSAYYRFQVPGQWQSISRPPIRADYRQLLKGNVVGNLTGIYNCKKLGKFYQQPVHHEDYLMWLQVTQAAKSIHAVPEPLAAYRVGQPSLSSNKLKSLLWTWQLYRNSLKLGVFYSLYLIVHYIGKALLKRL